jgi:CelD/BcsL family acetyltransferase involved in cellulose biosynthesis
MHAFVIHSEPDWEKWSSDWRLLSQANPMLSMEWLQAWWHTFGERHRLHILAVTQNDRLIAALPLYEHTSGIGKQLRFLGSGTACSDYMSPLVDRSCLADACRGLSEWMHECSRSGTWSHFDALRLDGVRADDPWAASLSEFSERCHYSIRAQSSVSSWELKLPSNWAELIASQRGKSIQRKAKKAASRIQSGELIIRHYDKVSDYEEAMTHMVRLHQARRESAGDEGCFRDPQFAAFLRQAMKNMLARGTARFCLCEHQGKPIAAQMQLLSDTTVFMYQTGADPHYMHLEPGHSVIAGALMYAMECGHTTYDFLRGDEPYKAFWGASPVALNRIILAPRTLKAQTLEAVHRNLGWLRSWTHETLMPIIHKGS